MFKLDDPILTMYYNKTSFLLIHRTKPFSHSSHPSHSIYTDLIDVKLISINTSYI